MKRKYKIIVGTYTLAALTALGVYSFAAHNMLKDYELAARYSSARAFEETVQSVDSMGQALQKSLYATDSAMMSSLCSDAYAGALAAETAMSTLPFSNYELEQLSAFLNLAGDYAYTLGRQGSAELKGEALEIMNGLSQQAGEFTAILREMQSGVNSGQLIMDRMQQPMNNVGKKEAGLLSESMRRYEGSLEKREIPEYDGKYNVQQNGSSGDLTEDEMKALAAVFAGVEVQQLKKEYDYAGNDGRQCYSAGDTLICVSPAGVESLGQTRLVSEMAIDSQQAEKAAEDYLKAMGFKNVRLSESKQNGAVRVMNFAAEENGVLWPDNYIKLAIAMDDGSVYSFNALNYSGDESGAQWLVDEKQARQAVPESLSIQSAEKIIVNSPGGEAQGCYSFECVDNMDKNVNICVDAKTGRQRSISIA